MPHYRCERCALLQYSAASTVKCAECGAPLAAAEVAAEKAGAG
jgi:ribosomal protein L37E